METNETMKADKKGHDKDQKFVIVRTIEDTLTKEELLMVYKQIKEAETNLQNQIADLPKQTKLRKEQIEKELAVITARRSSIDKLAKEAGWEESMLEKPKDPKAEKK